MTSGPFPPLIYFFLLWLDYLNNQLFYSVTSYFTIEAAYASTDSVIYRFKYIQLKGKPPKRKEKRGFSPPQLVRF